MPNPNFTFPVLISQNGVTHFQTASRSLVTSTVAGQQIQEWQNKDPAAAFTIVIVPKGQRQDFHTDQAKMYVIVLQGTVELVARDGTSKTFGPGSFGLVDDTAGQGHCTNNVGADDVVLACIIVP